MQEAILKYQQAEGAYMAADQVLKRARVVDKWAILLYQLGRKEETMQLYKRAQDFLPDPRIAASFKNKRALVLQSLHQFTDALALYDEVEPWLDASRLTDLKYHQAMCLYELRQYHEALVQVMQSETGFPEDQWLVRVLTLHALILHALNRVEEARELAQRAIDLAQRVLSEEATRQTKKELAEIFKRHKTVKLW